MRRQHPKRFGNERRPARLPAFGLSHSHTLPYAGETASGGEVTSTRASSDLVEFRHPGVERAKWKPQPFSLEFYEPDTASKLMAIKARHSPCSSEDDEGPSWSLANARRNAHSHTSISDSAGQLRARVMRYDASPPKRARSHVALTDVERRPETMQDGRLPISPGDPDRLHSCLGGRVATSCDAATPSALLTEDLQTVKAQAHRNKLRPLIVNNVELAQDSELETDTTAVWKAESSAKSNQATVQAPVSENSLSDSLPSSIQHTPRTLHQDTHAIRNSDEKISSDKIHSLDSLGSSLEGGGERGGGGDIPGIQPTSSPSAAPSYPKTDIGRWAGKNLDVRPKPAMASKQTQLAMPYASSGKDEWTRFYFKDTHDPKDNKNTRLKHFDVHHHSEGISKDPEDVLKSEDLPIVVTEGLTPSLVQKFERLYWRQIDQQDTPMGEMETCRNSIAPVAVDGAIFPRKVKLWTSTHIPPAEHLLSEAAEGQKASVEQFARYVAKLRPYAEKDYGPLMDLQTAMLKYMADQMEEASQVLTAKHRATLNKMGVKWGVWIKAFKEILDTVVRKTKANGQKAMDQSLLSSLQQGFDKLEENFANGIKPLIQTGPERCKQSPCETRQEQDAVCRDLQRRVEEAQAKQAEAEAHSRELEGQMQACSKELARNREEAQRFTMERVEKLTSVVNAQQAEIAKLRELAPLSDASFANLGNKSGSLNVPSKGSEAALSAKEKIALFSARRLLIESTQASERREWLMEYLQNLASSGEVMNENRSAAAQLEVESACSRLKLRMSRQHNSSSGFDAELAHSEQLIDRVLEASCQLSSQLEMSREGIRVVMKENVNQWWKLQKAMTSLMTSVSRCEKMLAVGAGCNDFMASSVLELMGAIMVMSEDLQETHVESMLPNIYNPKFNMIEGRFNEVRKAGERVALKLSAMHAVNISKPAAGSKLTAVMKGVEREKESVQAMQGAVKELSTTLQTCRSSMVQLSAYFSGLEADLLRRCDAVVELVTLVPKSPARRNVLVAVQRIKDTPSQMYGAKPLHPDDVPDVFDVIGVMADEENEMHQTVIQTEVLAQTKALYDQKFVLEARVMLLLEENNQLTSLLTDGRGVFDELVDQNTTTFITLAKNLQSESKQPEDKKEDRMLLNLMESVNHGVQLMQTVTKSTTQRVDGLRGSLVHKAAELESDASTLLDSPVKEEGRTQILFQEVKEFNAHTKLYVRQMDLINCRRSTQKTTMAWHFEQLRALQALATRIERAETIFLQQVVPAVKFPENDNALACVHGDINSIVTLLRHEAGVLRTSISQVRNHFTELLVASQAVLQECEKIREAKGRQWKVMGGTASQEQLFVYLRSVVSMSAIMTYETDFAGRLHLKHNAVGSIHPSMMPMGLSSVSISQALVSLAIELEHRNSAANVEGSMSAPAHSHALGVVSNVSDKAHELMDKGNMHIATEALVTGMGNSAYLMKLIQSLVALARLAMEGGEAAIEKAVAKFLAAQASCPLLSSALNKIVKCSRVFSTKVVEALASTGPEHSQHSSMASVAPSVQAQDNAAMMDSVRDELKTGMVVEIAEVEQNSAQAAAQLAFMRRQWIASSTDNAIPGTVNGGLSGSGFAVCPSCQHVFPNNSPSDDAAISRPEPFPSGTSAAVSGTGGVGPCSNILSDLIADIPSPAGERPVADAVLSSNDADPSSSLVSGEDVDMPHLDDSEPGADASTAHQEVPFTMEDIRMQPDLVKLIAELLVAEPLVPALTQHQQLRQLRSFVSERGPLAALLWPLVDEVCQSKSSTLSGMSSQKNAIRQSDLDEVNQMVLKIVQTLPSEVELTPEALLQVRTAFMINNQTLQAMRPLVLALTSASDINSRDAAMLIRSPSRRMSQPVAAAGEAASPGGSRAQGRALNAKSLDQDDARGEIFTLQLGALKSHRNDVEDGSSTQKVLGGILLSVSEEKDKAVRMPSISRKHPQSTAQVLGLIRTPRTMARLLPSKTNKNIEGTETQAMNTDEALSSFDMPPPLDATICVQKIKAMLEKDDKLDWSGHVLVPLRSPMTELNAFFTDVGKNIQDILKDPTKGRKSLRLQARRIPRYLALFEEALSHTDVDVTTTLTSLHVVLRHMLDYEDQASTQDEIVSLENDHELDSISSGEELDERATIPSPQPAIRNEPEDVTDPIASLDNAVGNLFNGSAKQHWQYEDILKAVNQALGILCTDFSVQTMLARMQPELSSTGLGTDLPDASSILNKVLVVEAVSAGYPEAFAEGEEIALRDKTSNHFKAINSSKSQEIAFGDQHTLRIVPILLPEDCALFALGKCWGTLTFVVPNNAPNVKTATIAQMMQSLERGLTLAIRLAGKRFEDIIYGLIEKSAKLNAKRLPDTAAALDFEMQSCQRAKKAVENLIWNTKPIRLTMNEFHKHNHADWAQVAIVLLMLVLLGEYQLVSLIVEGNLTTNHNGLMSIWSQVRRAFAEHKHASVERASPVLASPTKRRLQTDVRAHLAATSRRQVVTNETSFPVPASAVLDVTETSDGDDAIKDKKQHSQMGVASMDVLRNRLAFSSQDGGGQWENEPGSPMSYMVRTKKLIQRMLEFDPSPDNVPPELVLRSSEQLYSKLDASSLKSASRLLLCCYEWVSVTLRLTLLAESKRDMGG